MMFDLFISILLILLSIVLFFKLSYDLTELLIKAFEAASNRVSQWPKMKQNYMDRIVDEYYEELKNETKTD